MLLTGAGVALINPVVSVEAETSNAYTSYAYTPSKADMIDYYTATSSVDGGGVSTYAHASLKTPLVGNNIHLDTSFKLLDKNNVDGWLTYSFTANLGQDDKSYPYGGNTSADGYYFHVANDAGKASVSLNAVSDGNSTMVTWFEMENAIDVRFTFSLAKQTDGTYTFTALTGESVLATQTGLALNESLFINENGQTYLSTAIYETDGACDGNHAEHRGLTIYSVNRHSYCMYDYTPQVSDVIGNWGGISAIENGGVSIKQYAWMSTPLKGTDITLDTKFNLTAQSTFDGWFTYSFTSSIAGGDAAIPNNGGMAKGLFFNVTNVSSASAPNCVEVQIVQNDGATRTEFSKFFLDNALGENVGISFAKQMDGTYTWTVIKLADGSVLKTVSGLNLDESLFVSEQEQTYLSMAFYSAQEDANRNVEIYSMKRFDVPALDVVLSAESFVYTYGQTYTPVESVTLNGTVLTEDVDYTVAYSNNNAPGVATAQINFIGGYADIPMIEKTFTITEKVPEDETLKSIVATLQTSFKMREGASVKMSTPTGLRFGASLDITALEQLKTSEGVTNVRVGTIILPNDYLNSDELPRLDSGRVDGKDMLDIPCTNMDEKGNFYGAITNVKTANYDRDFVARAYVYYEVNGEAYATYAEMNDNVRSISYVASEALADTTKTYTDTQKKILQSFVVEQSEGQEEVVATNEQVGYSKEILSDGTANGKTLLQ